MEWVVNANTGMVEKRLQRPFVTGAIRGIAAYLSGGTIVPREKGK